MKFTKRFLSILGLAVFALAVIGGYRLSGANLTPQFKEKPNDALIINSGIDPYQISFKEGYGVCYAHHLGCMESGQWDDRSPNENLSNLDLEQIKALYPEPQWKIEENGHQLTIVHLQSGLCDKHKETLHLGLNETGEFLAVFYGPSVVGNQGGVAVAQLDERQKEKIANGYFELYSADELLGLLDSFSELE